MSEKEYKEQLRFCVEHHLYCFEYHRRHKDWKKEWAEYMKREIRCRGMENVKTN